METCRDGGRIRITCTNRYKLLFYIELTTHERQAQFMLDKAMTCNKHGSEVCKQITAGTESIGTDGQPSIGSYHSLENYSQKRLFNDSPNTRILLLVVHWETERGGHIV